MNYVLMTIIYYEKNGSKKFKPFYQLWEAD